VKVERGDELDVGRVAEEVDERDVGEGVAPRVEEADVAAEGRRVAADENEPRCVRCDELVDGDAPEARPAGSAMTTSAASARYFSTSARTMRARDPARLTRASATELALRSTATTDEPAAIVAENSPTPAYASITRVLGASGPTARRTAATSASAPSGRAWKNDPADTRSVTPSTTSWIHARLPARSSSAPMTRTSSVARPVCARADQCEALARSAPAQRHLGRGAEVPSRTSSSSNGCNTRQEPVATGSWLCRRRNATVDDEAMDRGAVALGRETHHSDRGQRLDFRQTRQCVTHDADLELDLRVERRVLQVAAPAPRSHLGTRRLDAVWRRFEHGHHARSREVAALLGELSRHHLAGQRAFDEHDPSRWLASDRLAPLRHAGGAQFQRWARPGRAGGFDRHGSHGNVAAVSSEKTAPRPIAIVPSVLPADFARLGEECVALEKAGVDRIQWDVMDGQFVPNLTFGPDVIKAVRPHVTVPFEAHLMVERPDHLLHLYVEAGCDVVIVHQEAAPPASHARAHLRARRVGAVALNPATPVAVIERARPRRPRGRHDREPRLRWPELHRDDGAQDRRAGRVGPRGLDFDIESTAASARRRWPVRSWPAPTCS
jgi:hypothetical protein